jgi:Ni,Fe-hydrogenase III small subunit
MTTAQWFIRGLSRGIVTTRYPKMIDTWAKSLPSPPLFDIGRLTEEMPDRLSAACPSGSLRREGDFLVLDVGTCGSCARCGEVAGVTRPSGQVELAAVRREDLLKRIPLKGSTPKPEDESAAELTRRTHKLFGRSLYIRTVDTGSCAACESEIRLLGAPHYDLQRLGFFFTPAPRHADLLLATGPAVRAADVLLGKTYEAMPDPKLVVAVGACALGGVWSEDELVHGSLDKVLPVDVYIPGCPPSPLALLQGLLVAVGRMEERVSKMTFTQDGGRSR